MLSLASAAVTACPTEMGSFMPGPRPRSPPRHRHHMLVKKSQNSFKEIVCYTCIACDITSCRVHYRTSLLTPLDSSNITDVPWAMDTGNKIFIGLCPHVGLPGQQLMQCAGWGQLTQCRSWPRSQEDSLWKWHTAATATLHLILKVWHKLISQD